MGVATRYSFNQMALLNEIRAYTVALGAMNSIIAINSRPSPSHASNVSSYNLQKYNDAHQGIAAFVGEEAVTIIESRFVRMDRPKDVLSTREYEGFRLAELAEITIECHKKHRGRTEFIFRPFKALFLEKFSHNRYYPCQYLAVCPELELEGIGGTKDGAFDDVCKLLDFYFAEAAQMGDGTQDFINLIETNINSSNPWKQGFYRLFWDTLAEKGIPFIYYRHSVSIGQ